MTIALKPGQSLFHVVETMQGGAPWGRVLDAGTGSASLSWLLQQQTQGWTAVTGARSMQAAVQRLAEKRMRAQDRIVLGNWMDAQLLAGEVYDTVLADYLVGAIEGFAPYWQERIFARLRPLVGKRLYVIGLEPYVPYLPETAAGRMVCEIGRLRDACLLLAGERAYREYPSNWVQRQLQQAGFRVLDVQHYGVIYGERFISNQLNMCEQRIGRLPDRALAAALSAHVQDVRQRALALSETLGGLAHCRDYVMAAQPLDL